MQQNDLKGTDTSVVGLLVATRGCPVAIVVSTRIYKLPLKHIASVGIWATHTK